MISIHRVLEHRARAVVALLALTLVALALSACGSSGGGGGGGGGDASALLKQTFANLGKIKGGKADLQLTIDVQGDASLRGPIKLGVTGPFQSEGAGKLPQFDLALDASLQGQGFQAGLTSTSDRMFVNFGGTSYEVPATLMTQLQKSLKGGQQSSAKGKLSLGSLGIDALGLLKDPTVQGTETIGGVETKHISAQLNVSALLDAVDKVLAKVSSQGLGAAGGQIPKQIPAKTRAQIQDAIKSASIDVWTGSADELLRKVAFTLAVQPKSPGSGPKSANVSFSLELQDLNKPQAITAPSSSRPLSELLGSLQGLLGSGAGGLLGGRSGGGSGGGSAGGSSSKQLDKYTKCLQAAGSDVAKAQACASLLTQ